MSKDSWTTIESDPGVFTELIQQMGVNGVQVEELYSLDENALEAIKPVYGLIFLFKWRSEKDDREIDHSAMEKVWFANQVINNACATQAIVSVLFNRPDIALGDELGNLKSFSIQFPPQMKGLAIGNSEVIRSAHNSFRLPEAFVSDDNDQDKGGEEAYHFISYVPVDGVLYELDGLKEGPIRLAECTEDDWLSLVAPFIQNRIKQYSKNEIRFNLMAVIRNRKEHCEELMLVKQALRDAARQKLSGVPSESGQNAGMDVDGDLPNDENGLNAIIAEADSEIERLQNCIAHEERKFQDWHDENIRRKHNYIPFLFNFLKVLGEKDLLKGLIQEAREKQEQQQKEQDQARTEQTAQG